MSSKVYNEKLVKLYTSRISEITEEIVAINSAIENYSQKLTHPLLIHTSDDYANADIKIMIFGQETNVWCKEVNDGVFTGDISEPISRYQIFFNERGYAKRGVPFFRFISELENRLKSLNQQTQTISVVWNNVIKIGQCSKGYPISINSGPSTIKSLNEMVKREVEILKPDILIFLSGYRYDHHIDSIFGFFEEIPLPEFDAHKFCKLNLGLDTLCLRTYHPNYLKFNPELRNRCLDEMSKIIHNHAEGDIAESGQV